MAQQSLARQSERESPHWLFDVVKPGHQMTAGEYHKLARDKVLELLISHHVFVVGGSGFYLQAFEKGMMPSPKTPPEIMQALQLKLESKGAKALHEELKLREPEYALRLNENDSYRVLRALSIMNAENKTMTEIAKQFESEQKSLRFSVEPTKVG
ncbi:MAG: tRNA dimethylallyltransferase, partial [Pseudomonadota bacterium]